MGRSRPRFLARLSAADRRIFLALSRWRSPVLDVVMPALTRAADHGVLWIAVAGAVGSLPSRRARRAARRGLVSLAASSALANQVGKRLVTRRRPDLGLVPHARRSPRVPTSSSFPSGHAASAAGFAVGVAVDSPALGAVTGVLAAAVAFSRVYTGVHHPSDVLAGLAIGTGVARVGARLLPPSPGPAEPVTARRVDSPARPTGAGVHIVVNSRAGTASGGALPARLRRDLPDAEVVVLGDGDDLAAALDSAADAGAQVLGAAGGDGTMNAAAGVAIHRGLPLLAVPAGTYNHFARDLGLDGPHDAVGAVRAGTARRVDVGRVDGRLFLNTASLGSYPTFVAVRERWERRIGRPLAALVAADTVLRGGHALDVEVAGRRRAIAALFVGAGSYQPRTSPPARRDSLDTGCLDVRYLEVEGRRPRLRPAARLARLRSGSSSPLKRVEVTEMTVLVRGETLLARDGEVGPTSGDRVTFTMEKGALTVFAPVARPVIDG